MRNFLIAALFFFFSTPLVSAEVPLLLHHQGRIIDQSGVPLSGTQKITFKLYSNATAQNEIWREDVSISFQNGYYSVQLGINSPLKVSLFENKELWLGITVGTGGQELKPRIRLASVPYAVMAKVAVNVKGGVIEAKEIKVGNKVVIDKSGKWVGDKAGLKGDSCSITSKKAVAGGIELTFKCGSQDTKVTIPSGPKGPKGDKGDSCSITSQKKDSQGNLQLVFKCGNNTTTVVVPRGPKGDKGDPGPKGPKGDKGDPGSAGGINLMRDTRHFEYIGTDFINLTGSKANAVWYYYSYNTQRFSAKVETPDSGAVQAILPQNSWWGYSWKVLRVKFENTGKAGGRLLQKLVPSFKSPGVMSMWVKVISGTLYFGREYSMKAIKGPTNWIYVTAVDKSPSKTLGGAWGFMAAPNSPVVEALIAFPKVETGITATPWVESPGEVQPKAGAFTCIPSRWSFSGYRTKVVVCETTIDLPYKAVVVATFTGHWRVNTSWCYASIEFDRDTRSIKDFCCGNYRYAPTHTYSTNWENVSQTRVKVLPPGRHRIAYSFYGNSWCYLNGSSLHGFFMPAR